MNSARTIVTGTVAILLTGVLGTLPTTGQTPPTPPEGYQWVKNDAFSDEFDGAGLDRDKWHDHNPRWKGRAPGKFMPSSISVKDGFLQIRSTVLDPPQGEFTVACGAIQSKAQDALYGYYECRMKASNITTSSTFWLTSSPKTVPRGTITLELDIQESIGNAQRFANFKTHMKSNTHVKFEPNAEGEEPKTVHLGGEAKLKSNVADDFHTYGCWWVDANTMKFYADGKYAFTINPPTDFDATPFNHPMVMN